MYVEGFREGVQFHTPFGWFSNGSFTTRSIRLWLRDQGYTVHAGTPPLDRKKEEQRDMEMAAANRSLGIESIQDGIANTVGDVRKGLREILAPLKKGYHLKSQIY